MASTYLTRTFTTPTNNKIWTLSFWIKRGNIGSVQTPFSTGSAQDEQIMRFESGDTFYILDYQSAVKIEIRTSRVFRDTSAWYHIVVAVDTTQATASNRVKIYVNGVQETSFGTETYPAQNTDLKWNSNILHAIGRKESGNNEYFDGSMAHVHFIDGTAYDASAFGSTDATTGIWKPKTAPSVTYGTNGFFLKFENSGAFGTDSSGNSNTFTVNGTMTQTIDTPSNVFATWNRLASHNNSITFSNGNTTGQSPNTGGFGGIATLGMQDGKYYMECKLISESATGESVIGVGADLEQDDLSGYIQGRTFHFGLRNSAGQKHENGTTTSSVHGGFTTGDIMGMAFDGATKKLTFSKNGGWWNGTSTWTGTSPDFTTHYLDCSGGSYNTFFFEVGDAGGSVNAKWSANFGNGYFGTTAVASAGTNSGIGTFEYDVPSGGYKALCTKSINEQEYS